MFKVGGSETITPLPWVPRLSEVHSCPSVALRRKSEVPGVASGLTPGDSQSAPPAAFELRSFPEHHLAFRFLRAPGAHGPLPSPHQDGPAHPAAVASSRSARDGPHPPPRPQPRVLTVLSYDFTLSQGGQFTSVPPKTLKTTRREEPRLHESAGAPQSRGAHGFQFLFAARISERHGQQPRAVPFQKPCHQPETQAHCRVETVSSTAPCWTVRLCPPECNIHTLRIKYPQTAPPSVSQHGSGGPRDHRARFQALAQLTELCAPHEQGASC